NNNINLCWHRSIGANPFQSLENLRQYWQELENLRVTWKAPNGIYWICGRKAYSEFPRKWMGFMHCRHDSTIIFSLPKSESNLLGAPL
ncbi:ENR1 protein, partial [Daphoenositta chrysoptera]|nr:ENR1 protein [Daphoenositta chrysoptera]NWV49570.1 ENR1 protein [Daphoenositta chrysoptera]